MPMRLLAALVLVYLAACSSPFNAEYRHDFSKENALAGLALSDPSAWRLDRDDSIATLDLVGPSEFVPPFRSPKSLAIVQGIRPRDFDLEVDVLSTAREYDHRDLCIVFGYVAPDRFYYVHLATKPDPHAHNVFVVDRADRVALAPLPARGVAWGENAWHRVRVERRVESGSIRVFFDGALVLEASDTRFSEGQVGVGSFDDTGRFARFRLSMQY